MIISDHKGGRGGTPNDHLITLWRGGGLNLWLDHKKGGNFEDIPKFYINRFWYWPQNLLKCFITAKFIEVYKFFTRDIPHFNNFHLQLPFKYRAINGRGEGGYVKWSLLITRGGGGVWRGPKFDHTILEQPLTSDDSRTVTLLTQRGKDGHSYKGKINISVLVSANILGGRSTINTIWSLKLSRNKNVKL